jgi:hypothetical protein
MARHPVAILAVLDYPPSASPERPFGRRPSKVFVIESRRFGDRFVSS